MSRWAGRPCLRNASSSASRPRCSASSRRSRLNHCRILLRAPELATNCSQSRDGPCAVLEVRISTMSPDCSL